MPYQLVKDHRTEYENGNIDNVMNGDLDGFINAFLSMKAESGGARTLYRYESAPSGEGAPITIRKVLLDCFPGFFPKSAGGMSGCR